MHTFVSADSNQWDMGFWRLGGRMKTGTAGREKKPYEKTPVQAAADSGVRILRRVCVCIVSLARLLDCHWLDNGHAHIGLYRPVYL